MLKRFYLISRKLFVLVLIAVLIGILSGLINALFGHVLHLMTDVRTKYIYLLVPLLGTIGTFIVWCYQKFGGDSSKGMTLVFEASHNPSNSIPLRLIPFSIVATWLTHLFGGSAGREGVAIQIGSTVAHGVSRAINIPDYKRILLIVGIAAGFAGLFRTPLVATFFAIEVLIVGRLEKKAFLPALIASYTASYVSGLLGLEKYSFALTDKITFSWSLALQIIIMGSLFGIIGKAFSLCLHKTKAKFSRWFQSPLWRVFIIGNVVGSLSLLCWSGRYSGLGTNLISMSFEHNIYTWDFALKFLFTILTIAAGFQGGEVTPLFSIGATLGAGLASLLGLPVPFGAALGYAAVFGSATNTLIAPIVIGYEVFGGNHLFYFAAVHVIAYMCNGNVSIYPLQKKSKRLENL